MAPAMPDRLVAAFVSATQGTLGWPAPSPVPVELPAHALVTALATRQQDRAAVRTSTALAPALSAALVQRTARLATATACAATVRLARGCANASLATLPQTALKSALAVRRSHVTAKACATRTRRVPASTPTSLGTGAALTAPLVPQIGSVALATSSVPKSMACSATGVASANRHPSPAHATPTHS